MKFDLEKFAAVADLIEDLIKLVAYMSVTAACFKYVLFS